MEINSTKYKKMLEDLITECKKNLPTVNEGLISKAFQLSFEAHKNDFRASGEPYFNHPYAVALVIAREIPLDETSVIAALLHDVVEDTEISLQFLENEFSKEIASIVDGVTKISGMFIGHQFSQAENYRKLILSMVSDVRVILVKFADRLHNMRTLEFVKPDKQVRIARETIEIYAPFAHRFGLGKLKWELEDLSFKYLNKEAYNDLVKKIKNKRKEREGFIARFIKPIEEKLIEHNLQFEIGGRAKHIYSIYRKMMKQNSGFDQIFDLLAVRIILESNDPNECYYVLGIINQHYKPIPDRFKDYISIPKKNNYQSIHNTVIGPEGKLMEVQIRTRMMHEIAEKGVAAHWKYKENKSSADSELEEWVNWIRDIFENATRDEAAKEFMASFKLNLYQDEIYVFTPQGDLKRLPVNSTPVDFAYQVHSKVGHNCIGAKVNGKIVPLDTKLQSGDQVDIITSKNQHPNKNWLQFVQTHKAKADIRKYINKEEDDLVENGKNIWEKKLKKLKLSFSSDETLKLARKLRFDNNRKFFRAIYEEKVDLDELLNPSQAEPEQTVKSDSEKEVKFDTFAEKARHDAGGILVDGEHKGFATSFARCCNPIPGDPVIGYITIGEGIKIHRKDCKNMQNMADKIAERLIPVSWPKAKSGMFIGGISVKGEDRPGLLQSLSNIITTYNNTNIKAANIDSQGSSFSGLFTVYIENLDHLNRLMEKIKKIKGVYQVERFYNTN